MDSSDSKPRRTVAEHQCPQDGKCAVCNTPSWQVRHASEIELLLGHASEWTVILSGNTPEDISEAYGSLLIGMGWN